MGWRNPEKKYGRFINPHILDIKRKFLDLILWFFGYYAEPHKRKAPPPGFHYPDDLPPIDHKEPSAVWIGHSTFLIQVNGLVFLTDPLFSSYCSPIPIRALKRQHEPPFAIHELPPIDYVLISHDHYDHLDEKSVAKLHRRFPNIRWIVPLGLKRWFEQRGIDRVEEMDWGDVYSFDFCRITAVPAQHFSGRGLFDQNRTLWCGFVIECRDKTFYFVGDTGYNSVDFKEIGSRWRSIDLSLIPIGTYAPQKFMQPVHIGPDEAVQIHLQVHSRFSLGIHWKTFCLSEEPLDLPPYDLYLAMQKHKLPFSSFIPIEPGRTVNW